MPARSARVLPVVKAPCWAGFWLAGDVQRLVAMQGVLKAGRASNGPWSAYRRFDPLRIKAPAAFVTASSPLDSISSPRTCTTGANVKERPRYPTNTSTLLRVANGSKGRSITIEDEGGCGGYALPFALPGTSRLPLNPIEAQLNRRFYISSLCPGFLSQVSKLHIRITAAFVSDAISALRFRAVNLTAFFTPWLTPLARGFNGPRLGTCGSQTKAWKGRSTPQASFSGTRIAKDHCLELEHRCLFNIVSSAVQSSATPRGSISDIQQIYTCDLWAPAIQLCTAMPFRQRVKNGLKKGFKKGLDAAADLFKSRSPSPAPIPQDPNAPDYQNSGQGAVSRGEGASREPRTDIPHTSRHEASGPSAVAPGPDPTTEGAFTELVSPRPIVATLQVPRIPVQDLAVSEGSEAVRPEPSNPPTIASPEIPKIIVTQDRATAEVTRDVEQEPPNPISSAPEANPAPESTTSYDKSTWYRALRTTLTLVERASDAFPPLKSTAAGLNALMELKDAFYGNREEFDKLEKRVILLDEILGGRSDLPPGIQDRHDGLARAVEAIGAQLKERIAQTNLQRLAAANDDKQEIVRLIREINFAIEFAMVRTFSVTIEAHLFTTNSKLDVTIRNETLILQAVEGIDWMKGHSTTELKAIRKDISGIAEGVASLIKAEELKTLGSVDGYEFSIQNQRAHCVAGSRVALISRLLAWAEDRSSAHAFWLSGIAGAGKTAVSETLCVQLSNRGLLGASFFCSIKVDDLRDVFHIIPSLARTLATTYPKFGNALAVTLQNLRKDPVRQLELSEQYDSLILGPAEVAFRDQDTNIVLCVDALDECKKIPVLRTFLKLILSKKPPIAIKFFLTSRPEPDIKEEVESLAPSLHRQTFRLHEIDKQTVRADIALYVSQELKEVPRLRDKYRENWPPLEVKTIIDLSDSLFIVAATVVRDICAAGNPVKRLQEFSKMPKLTDVYMLYGGILERATQGLRPGEEQDLHSCLSLLVVALRPLSLVEYAALLSQEVDDILSSFNMLHSVVKIPTDKDDPAPIAIHHASFADFLTNVGMVGAGAGPLLPINRQVAHSMAVKRCLLLMDDPAQGVSLGVSNAVTSYRSNDEQGVKLVLRSDLAYACTSWGNHALAGLPLSNSLQVMMKKFLQEKGLFWLEALSAGKNVGYSSILWELSKGMTIEGSGALLIAIRDFTQMFATPISHSAPHLYLSALPFYQAALGQSPWWSLNIPSIPTVHSNKGTKANQQRVLVQANAPILCLAISPDGSQLISGDSEGIVNMWNTQSGEPVLGDMAGHLNWVRSVTFSPDGSKVVSGSDDSTIRVWDAKTGQPLGSAIKGHQGCVYSAVFSPDGSRIVSGSRDKTIRIWDALTGEALGDPIEGHAGDVNTVAVSPDGLKIISGSDDRTIRVWDAQNRQLVLGPLQGHTGAILSVAVSSDGLRIVSGSRDNTIRVWDAWSGQDMFSPIEGHSGCVCTVTFSPDGSKIVSGSYDRTIRLWDAQSGHAVGRPMEGHSNWVTAVTFTPDGLKIISGSEDGTIRIWDLQADHTTGDLEHCHTGSVTSVAYSPDGSRIVSGSNDKTVRVWDAKTGQALVGPMEGHSKFVASVAFSPDGSRIVSGSHDKTIRIWDAQSGAIVLGPLQGHSSFVLSVAFSPDGSRIASGSGDCTIQLWDAETGQPFLDPFTGHTDWVRYITFSPCGTRLVSGSDDRTVRVWDVQSGQVVLGPLHGRKGIILSVAFSPDGSKIVSGSDDQTIQVWDAHNGRKLLGPLRGHSDVVWSAAFSPDGLKIASGSSDKTICIWDAQSRELIYTLQGHSNEVNSVSFSPDSTQIVSGSEDKTIRVWNLDQAAIDKPSFLHHYPAFSLTMDDNGWIQNASKDLLLWVPPQFRSSIYLPHVEFIIGPSTQIDLSHAIHHGPNWRRCIEPPEPHKECPWPYTR
ncbi:hypothetical protein NMY22_g7564 [Coprinellus aureogranulatus]|nr:hypothetical protein NMY22_g7564 [Coprinellus aureogranulatus]